MEILNTGETPVKTGTLYLIATPIGNLEDITLRAIRLLGEVDVIAAEDTRQTIKLLNHLGIKKPMISYYEHNKAGKGGYLVRLLLEGKNLALVSDAGSPGISDPGEDMVRLAIENNIPVTMLPGPAALISGVVLSGFPTGRFVFEGFLPVNKKDRNERLQEIKDETRTIIFYEAPHKLMYTLRDILENLGDRRISLARELTKRFEEVVRCNVSEAIARYESNAPKGEFVIAVEGREEKAIADEKRREWDDISLREHYEIYAGQGMERKAAMKKVADERGIPKRDVYNALIEQD
ncbi:MAG: 16S rRNA (cytidine(1402)-2'-O)-methyltransferase [Clostridiales bacterium]|nr:16S rRNA (cytidine(1402)-2'-O)-methyltransferase [Clostridiales bacterium]